MDDLFSLDGAEYKMAHLDYMKNHCKEMLMIFENLLTSYDSAEMDADEWDCQLYFFTLFRILKFRIRKWGHRQLGLDFLKVCFYKELSNNNHIHKVNNKKRYSLH